MWRERAIKENNKVKTWSDKEIKTKKLTKKKERREKEDKQKWKRGGKDDRNKRKKDNDRVIESEGLR